MAEPPVVFRCACMWRCDVQFVSCFEDLFITSWFARSRIKDLPDCVLPRAMRCCEYQNLVVTKCFIQHFFASLQTKNTGIFTMSFSKCKKWATCQYLHGLWMLNLKLNLVGRFRSSEAVDQRDCNCNDPFVAEEWPWLQNYWYWFSQWARVHKWNFKSQRFMKFSLICCTRVNLCGIRISTKNLDLWYDTKSNNVIAGFFSSLHRDISTEASKEFLPERLRASMGAFAPTLSHSDWVVDFRIWWLIIR